MEGKTPEKEKEEATFWIVIALVILASGIIWLGNDLGWWQISLPFWPIVVIAVSLAILVTAIRKLFGKR